MGGLNELERATVRNMREHLEEWILRGSKYEKHEAMHWYERAHDVAEYLATEYGITLPQAAAVISVLSPGCPWEQNTTDADKVCQAWHDKTYDATVTTYHPQLGKAYSILDHGKDKDAHGIESMIGKVARKTKAFYWNILEPSARGPVTVDRWILRALGLPINRTTEQLYRLAEIAITQVADKRGVLPQVMQAYIWVCIRRCQGELNVTRVLPGF